MSYAKCTKNLGNHLHALVQKLFPAEKTYTPKGPYDIWCSHGEFADVCISCSLDIEDNRRWRRERSFDMGY